MIVLTDLKERKMDELRQLQDRIEKLKQEEQKIIMVRSEWQSPATRPETVRTARSPPFRSPRRRERFDDASEMGSEPSAPVYRSEREVR